MTQSNQVKAIALVAVVFSAMMISGCAPLLIGGGVAGGYAIAKHEENHH